jgi:RimK family alpha-L-glutamate ligase
MRVALATDTRDWHARELRHAFARAGVAVVPMRLAECGFDSTAPHGMVLPGMSGALPDAMLVRHFGGGGFEAVTRRLGILHALAARGIALWNDARAIERCVDKSATTHLAAAAGIAVPPTWAVEGRAAACAVLAAQGGDLVLKPLFGAQGIGLRRIETAADLPAEEAVGGVYYLQRYVAPGGSGFRDHRLFVVAGEVVAAMTREAEGWVTNLRQGGRPLLLQPDAAMRGMAERATEAVGAHYAGVDIMLDADGAPLLLEVNSMPGWRGLQAVTPHRIADCLAAALLAGPR